MTDRIPSGAPARRRRHARLIAALARLVAECANAALAVYEPVAAAPPGQGNITVSLRALTMLAATAGPLLDHAAGEDTERWPEEADREHRASLGTFAARAVTAEAESVLFDVEFPPGDITGDPPAVPLPLPTPGQAAALGLVEAGDVLLDVLDREPHRLAVLLRELTGDFTTDEVQASAVHSLAATGCLMLREAADQDDPSTAAEACMSAARFFARAVTVASMDLDDESDHAPVGGGPA